MTGLFTKKDGRLKTGRVAIMAFAVLLLTLGILFKINHSVDQALMAVKHVFEPAAVEPVRQQKPAVRRDARRVEPEKADTVAQEKLAAPVERTEDPEKAAQAGNEKVETTPEGKQKVETAPASQEKAEAAQVQEEARPEAAKEVETEETSPQPEKPDADQEIKPYREAFAEIRVQEAQSQEDKGGDPTRNDESSWGDLSRILAKDRKKPLPADSALPDRTASESPVRFDQAGLAKIARKSSERDTAKAEPASKGIDVPEKKARMDVSKAIGRLYEANDLQVDPKKREVTVNKETYKALFQSWRVAGKDGKGKEKIPMQVENLRNTYDLFQMKPVAVIRGDAYLDLSDGTRIAEGSLAEYSNTVFLVDRPWDKWGAALSAAGIRRGDKLEVRYYMYDFIRSAIYARVHQAFSWCRSQGLIAKDATPAAVDVLGRAYVINKEGGGRFGVFVPVSLEIGNGRTVAVDPGCFHGQADVDTLRMAGVL